MLEFHHEGYLAWQANTAFSYGSSGCSIEHPREYYERMIQEFSDKAYYGKIVPLYLCGDALMDQDTQNMLYQYLMKNSKRFGKPQKGPFGIIFLDSDYKRIGVFLDDLFNDSKKEIYAAVERLALDRVGSLL